MIEEKVYELEGNADPEDVVADILKLTPQQAQAKEKEIIGSYPNTYTFTKSMAERVLYKRRGTKKIVIFRPSVIINTYEHPVRGYTESLSAGQIFIWAMMTGLIKYINVSEFSLDVVPVDYVSNMIIACTAKLGQSPAGSF